jgi:hypothetical protein
MVVTSVHHAHADLPSQRRFDGVVAFVSVMVTCSRENPAAIIGKFWKNFSPETKKLRTARGLRHPPQSVTGFRSLAHLWIYSSAKFDTLHR